MQLKEVFTPGGQPSVTYVGREHLQLEDAVRGALARGYALNVVTGPTKSGKTVLCKRVLANAAKFIVVEGGQVRNEDDFWRHISFKLNIANTAVKAASSTMGIKLEPKSLVAYLECWPERPALRHLKQIKKPRRCHIIMT